jgi:hypothetical protein
MRGRGAFGRARGLLMAVLVAVALGATAGPTMVRAFHRFDPTSMQYGTRNNGENYKWRAGITFGHCPNRGLLQRVRRYGNGRVLADEPHEDAGLAIP